MIETTRRADNTRVLSANRRVVLVSELYPPDTGGSAALFGNIYPRLQSELTVIRNATPQAGVEGTGGRTRTVSVPMTGGHWGVSSIASLRRHARTLAAVLAESRNQLAVVHCGRALPEGLAALWASRLRGGLRYLCWAHGEELLYAKSSRELTFLLGHVLRGASALLANSFNTARELDALAVPKDKVHVVHPGVDAERFVPSGRAREIHARHAGPGDVLMVTVGRLQRRKGHDLAIEALARGGAALERVRYLIVGDGDERARLEQLAVEHGVGDRVMFTGAVSGDLLPDYYGAGDVFVHPNRIDGNDTEGFGIVFLEAAAAGLPTIGGASGGVPEALEKDVTGLLVSGTDPDELAAAIGTLASSTELRRRMGDAGRDRVRQRFTWERAAEKVGAIHHRLLANARAERGQEILPASEAGPR